LRVLVCRAARNLLRFQHKVEVKGVPVDCVFGPPLVARFVSRLLHRRPESQKWRRASTDDGRMTMRLALQRLCSAD
jgi:hypothetical protein